MFAKCFCFFKFWRKRVWGGLPLVLVTEPLLWSNKDSSAKTSLLSSSSLSFNFLQLSRFDIWSLSASYCDDIVVGSYAAYDDDPR